MTLVSGSIPYSYDYGHGAFHVPKPYESAYPIGPSGVLLEQAQFVITAELRKWKKFDGINGSHTLPDFNLYVNSNLLPSGRYEPKINGSTLGNSIYPGSLVFIDSILETRSALFQIFSEVGGDTNDDYFIAWLSALYPNNPSGTLGLYSRREPSEIGIIDYASIEVLGGSGVLYDVDFGELMYNPFPHISVYQTDSAHSESDPYDIQQGPLFPAFQKTDGSLVPLTGREPDFIDNTFDSYRIAPISSGTIFVNGYCLQTDTKYYLNQGGYIFDVTGGGDFTHFEESFRRAGNGGNIPTTRSYVTPSAQGSGLYRILAINKRANFPNTTIPSSTVSSWPQLGLYPTYAYHVFDDAIWITDNTNFSNAQSAASTIRGHPSGLTLLSPFNMDRLWIRYADQTKFDCTPSFGLAKTYRSWASGTALIRASSDNIYRFHDKLQRPFTNTSGQLRLARYNDDLAFTADITSTSDAWDPVFDEFPLGGDVGNINDIWHDNISDEYWVSNANAVGIDMWKFDSSFKYLNKYVFNLPSGIANSRGVFINGQHFLFHGEFSSGGVDIIGSGIYPVHIVAEGTEPYDNTATVPKVGEAYVSPPEGKFINGAPFVGHRPFGEIMDIIEVTSATHVIPGVYALVRWDIGAARTLYLLRIEEEATSWEVRAITLFEAGLPSDPVRREILYMPY